MVAQWLAWRSKLPAILLLSVAGILVGPVFGWVNPQEELGDLVRPLIGLSVAVILFEGSLNLRFFELRKIAPLLIRLLGLAVPLAAIFGMLAAYFIGGFSWPIASVLGCLLVVTGPTVIVPLLRHAKLNARVASILRWEGIINDPIGALLAVLVFEFLLFAQQGASLWAILPLLILSLVASALVAFSLAHLTRWLFGRRLMPEYLKVPFVLSIVLGSYGLANRLQPESGLMMATFLGIAFGNQKFPEIDELRRFKESISLLLLTLVFVILTASIEPDLLLSLDIKGILFLAAMLFLVRPAAVLFSTLKSKISWKERLFVGWIAPRGIVAAAVAGIFGPELVDHGYVDGAQILPLVFTFIFVTVIIHGLTVKPLAKCLGLASEQGHTLLVVGASPWSVSLVDFLNDHNVHALLADKGNRSLRRARHKGLSVYEGEVLSDAIEEDLDLTQFNAILAVSDNDAYDALVCTRFANEMGWQSVFQLAFETSELMGQQTYAKHMRGQFAFAKEVKLESLMAKFYQGWKFRILPKEDVSSEDQTRVFDKNLPLMVIHPKKGVHVLACDEKIRLENEEFLVTFSMSETKSS